MRHRVASLFYNLVKYMCKQEQNYYVGKIIPKLYAISMIRLMKVFS